jgi:Flp pilus assembly pilin Flp
MLMGQLGRTFEHNRVTAIEYGLIAAVKAIKYGVIAATMVSILGAVGVNPIAVFSDVIRGLQLP